jgi:NAD(P)-dependent dehydrogenase (short-subunit alcohol dehydrogenase family)
MTVERVLVLTGAAGGIGAAFVERIAKPGFAFVLSDAGTDVEGFGGRNDALDAVASLARSRGAEVLCSNGDNRDASDASSLVNTAIERWGRLDASVACAGLHRERSASPWIESDAHDVIALALVASIRLAAVSARAMIERKSGGSVVLMTSPSGMFGAARQSLMAAAAGGIVGYVRSAAVEWKRHRIRINAVAPTARTRQTGSLPLFQSLRDGSMGPGAVASFLDFLTTDVSADVSGEVLGVAGPRIYSLRAKESPGAFFEDELSPHDSITERWREIVR